MKWMLHIAAVSLVCGILTVAGPVTSASSAPTPSLTVTPDTALVGGQTVTVAGSGFSPSTTVGFCEARMDSNPSTGDCAGGSVFHVARTDANGAFSENVVLARFITPIFPKETLDCAQSVQCEFGAAESTSGPFAVVPLNFAPQPPATFSIKGSVTGPDGHAVADVAVWAYTSSDSFVGSFQTMTDANGAYQLDIDPTLSYAVRFGPPAGSDLIAQWFPNQTHRSSATPVQFLIAFNDPVLTLGNQQLAAGGAIAGVVTNHSGTGVSGVTVWAYGPGDTWVGSFGTTTAADGSYRISGVRAADYKVRFMPPSASGLAIEWYDNAKLHADATSVSVTAGATTTGIDTQLSPSS